MSDPDDDGLQQDRGARATKSGFEPISAGDGDRKEEQDVEKLRGSADEERQEYDRRGDTREPKGAPTGNADLG
jgi:hypothetical protein